MESVYPRRIVIKAAIGPALFLLLSIIFSVPSIFNMFSSLPDFVRASMMILFGATLIYSFVFQMKLVKIRFQSWFKD
jgi:hypothetical protein